MEASAVLALPMQPNDADAATIGDYLKKLLLGVWEEGEGFDGKRPFGNSSWEWEVYAALVSNHAIEGTFDSEGCLDQFDRDAANALVVGAVEWAFGGGPR